MTDRLQAQFNLGDLWGKTLHDPSKRSGASDTLMVILRDSAIEVLHSQGIRAVACETIGELSIAALIGFSGECASGALGIASSDEVLAATYLRACSDEGNAALHQDWLRELSNLVLGRVKARLLLRGFTVYIAVPQTLRGLRLQPDTAHVGSSLSREWLWFIVVVVVPVGMWATRRVVQGLWAARRAVHRPSCP